MGIPSNKKSNSSISNSNSSSNSTHTTPTPTNENDTESPTLPSPSPSQSPSSSHSLSPSQSQSTSSSNQFISINNSSNNLLELNKIHNDYKKFNHLFTKYQSIDNINELNKLINKKFNLNLIKDPIDENLIIIQPKSKKKLLLPNSTSISKLPQSPPPPTILFNETPFIEIPSFEFLKLIELGRCCSNCSDVLKLDKGRLANPESQKSSQSNSNNNNNNNSEYSEEVAARYMNGLDCDICNLKWCSIECKQMDIFHTLLNHQPTNKSFINSILNTNKQKINLKYNNWLILKKFIILNNLSSIFSVFILILWFNYDIDLFNSFNSLKSIKIDDIIDKENHLINYLKTLNNMNRTNKIINNNNNKNDISDEENDKISIEDDGSTELNEEIYLKSYELICDCLPNCPFELSYLQFLRILIKFKLNNFNGSIFLFASHLKHSCEPNCSIDFIEEDKEINDSSVSDNSYYFLSINNLLNSAIFSRQTSILPQLLPQIKSTEDTNDDDNKKNKNNNNHQSQQPKNLVTNKNYEQVFSNSNKSNGNTTTNNVSKNNGKKQNNKKSKEIKHLSEWNSTAQGIQLKLLKSIDKNETLTINYLENPPLDVNERRLEILKKFNFWCDCPLCTRQSELESDNTNTNNINNSVSIFNNKSLMMSSMQPKPSTSPQNLTLHSHPRTRRVSITSMTSTNSANSQDKQSLILQQPLSDKENISLSLPSISTNKQRKNSVSSLNQVTMANNNNNNSNILSSPDMNSYSLSNFNISNENQETKQQQSTSSVLPIPAQHTRKPSFTSSGGSFGEGILKYSRKQISEMLDNLYIDATNNLNNNNNGSIVGSISNSGVFLDAVIDEEDEDGELELELPVPTNFNRGKRKSVRFDDDNIILN
ncbi:hypothetical protein B5S28_g3564 [[Candida] boidinii]|nr:hypothetical protein B5S28_g3564 [[Candida] boidinii]OWB72096.1 hypothetical protein B5S31_g1798 [[Candida] boidinii]